MNHNNNNSINNIRLYVKIKHVLVAVSVLCLQECVALQPSMLDFMQRRGRVLKKMGALTRAAEAVDAARQLDKADRYMNSKV